MTRVDRGPSGASFVDQFLLCPVLYIVYRSSVAQHLIFRNGLSSLSCTAHIAGSALDMMQQPHSATIPRLIFIIPTAHRFGGVLTPCLLLLIHARFSGRPCITRGDYRLNGKTAALSRRDLALPHAVRKFTANSYAINSFNYGNASWGLGEWSLARRQSAKFPSWRQRVAVSSSVCRRSPHRSSVLGCEVSHFPRGNTFAGIGESRYVWVVRAAFIENTK